MITDVGRFTPCSLLSGLQYRRGPQAISMYAPVYDRLSCHYWVKLTSILETIQRHEDIVSDQQKLLRPGTNHQV